MPTSFSIFRNFRKKLGELAWRREISGPLVRKSTPKPQNFEFFGKLGHLAWKFGNFPRDFPNKHP